MRIDLDAAGVERCIAEAGIGFLFAPVFHPSMAHAGPVRRELRVPTVFNFLGPLTNPSRPAAQAVGCSDARMLPLMAEVLARRGTRAMLFRGDDGLDELTTTGPSTVFDVARRAGPRDGTSTRPNSGWLGPAVEDLQGGDAREPRRPSSGTSSAGEPGPRRDVVVLNAAAALEVAGRTRRRSRKASSWPRRRSIRVQRPRRSSAGSRSAALPRRRRPEPIASARHDPVGPHHPRGDRRRPRRHRPLRREVHPAVVGGPARGRRSSACSPTPAIRSSTCGTSSPT